MNELLKVVIYIKNISKPIVFSNPVTNEESKIRIIDMLDKFRKGNLDTLIFDNGDIFMCNNKDDIISIMITRNKLND